MTTPDDDDDERTVFKSRPGASAARSALHDEFTDALPAATRLHEFEILSVIGQGGFGIVYLAHDLTLGRRVALKEYMPSALATRTQAMTVAVRSTRHAETFAAGLRSFVNEARLLAQFDHPSLLKVHRFWEAHGTAYIVMPYYAGITLAKQLSGPGGPPAEAWLRALLEPLLDALALMHAAQCYHRDIAPDNILLLPDGTPLLLDFGAARHVIEDMTQALTVILKTGYAPVEQYGAMPEMSQGAWTDLYALGSVVEFAITGHTPPQAVARFLADKRLPLAVTAAGRYSDAFLRAIDRTLAVLPKDRPQSVAEMRALLAAAPAPASARVDQGEITVPMIDLLPPAAPTSAPRESAPAMPAPATNEDAAPGSRRRSIGISAAVVAIALAALAGGYAWFATPQAAAPVAVAPAAVAPAAPVAVAPAVIAPAAPPPNMETMSVGSAPGPAATPSRSPADAPSATPRQPEAARPREHSAAQTAREPPPPAQSSQPIPNKKLPSARCADIIQLVSLGEPLSEAEKTFLKLECRP